MKHIGYISLRDPAFEDSAVADMVIQAGYHNRAHDITGCLWVGPLRFFQVIEGPEQPIDELYGRIQADKRHSAVHTLVDEPIVERHFSRWGMTLVRSDEYEEISAAIDRLVPEANPIPSLESEDGDRPLIQVIISGLANWLPLRTAS